MTDEWTMTEWLASTRRLQEDAFRHSFPMTGDKLADYWMMNMAALTAEMGEFAQEVGWKPWIDVRGWMKRDAAVGELVDIMHFLGNLLVAMEVTDEELAERYPTKQEINAYRQANGYTGRNKCPGCGRALDDPTTSCGEPGDLHNLGRTIWCDEKKEWLPDKRTGDDLKAQGHLG